MTVYRIPAPLGSTTPITDQRTALDGREYVIGFAWNTREERWYLSLADEAGVPIARAKLVVNTPMFRRVQDARKPPGWIVALSENDTPPGFDELDGRVVLYYYDAAEILLGNTAPVTTPDYVPNTIDLDYLVMDGNYLTVNGSRLYI